MKTSKEYQQEAQAFLDRFGLKVRAVLKGDRCPPWTGSTKADHAGCPRGECNDVHGDRYRVTISRRGDYMGNQGLTPKRIAFDFWNSLNACQKGEEPTAYDVLACISSDVYCPETFEDFCGEYGYEQDSRKAFAVFKRCATFAEKLRAFLTEDEQEALAEIQ